MNIELFPLGTDELEIGQKAVFETPAMVSARLSIRVHASRGVLLEIDTGGHLCESWRACNSEDKRCVADDAALGDVENGMKEVISRLRFKGRCSAVRQCFKTEK